jgi:hypothetical protein
MRGQSDGQPGRKRQREKKAKEKGNQAVEQPTKAGGSLPAGDAATASAK